MTLAWLFLTRQVRCTFNKHWCAQTRPKDIFKQTDPQTFHWSTDRLTHQQSDRLMNRHTGRSNVILIDPLSHWHVTDLLSLSYWQINRFPPLYIFLYCTAWWNSNKNCWLVRLTMQWWNSNKIADWSARSCCSLIGQSEWAHTAAMVKFNGKSKLTATDRQTNRQTDICPPKHALRAGNNIKA